MNMVKQTVGFLLGITVAFCLHSLLKFRNFSLVQTCNGSWPARPNRPRNFLRPPWVQRSLPANVAPSMRLNGGRDVHGAAPAAISRIAAIGSPRRPKPAAAKLAGRNAPDLAHSNPGAAFSTQAAGMKLNTPPPATAAAGPPPPTVFKSIGYVENGEGQLEAIILQDNEVQVVQIGDHISGRYRVTDITRESVDAIDETLPEVAQAKVDGSGTQELTAGDYSSGSSAFVAAVDSHAPAVSLAEAAQERSKEGQPGANALGYVQRADGKVEAVIADGDSVRLVNQMAAQSTANAASADLSRGAASAPPDPATPEPSVALGPEPIPARSAVSTIQPDADAVRQVAYPASAAVADGPAPRQSIAAPAARGSDEMDATGDPGFAVVNLPEPAASLTERPVEMKSLGYVVKADGTFAAILSEDDEIYVVRKGDRFAGRYRALRVSTEAVEAMEEPPKQALPLPFEPASPPSHRQELSATVIFQTLGYVQSQDGEMRAVVADGRDVYLVKQGETFADQYRATSVDPILVLAVRVFPEERTENFLASQTDLGKEPASNQLFTHLHFPTVGIANAGAFPEGSGHPLLVDLGMKLLGSSSAGDGEPSYFFDGR